MAWAAGIAENHSSAVDRDVRPRTRVASAEPLRSLVGGAAPSGPWWRPWWRVGPGRGRCRRLSDPRPHPRCPRLHADAGDWRSAGGPGPGSAARTGRAGRAGGARRATGARRRGGKRCQRRHGALRRPDRVDRVAGRLRPLAGLARLRRPPAAEAGADGPARARPRLGARGREAAAPAGPPWRGPAPLRRGGRHADDGRAVEAGDPPPRGGGEMEPRTAGCGADS